VPGGRDGLCGPEGYDSGVIDRLRKRSSVTDYDGHDEQRAGEIAPECDEPVQQHFPGRKPAVQDGDRCELFVEQQKYCQLRGLIFFAHVALIENTHHETPRTQVRPR
jgi:hypothetical protein